MNEIGELSLMAQSKLLTVLDTHSIRRIGSQRSIDLRFRLICATNRDLPKLVRQKRFREDLWYRINTLQLVMPPLRERREDIIPIAEYYIALYAESMKLGYRPVLSDPMKLELLKKSWRGNIRELRNWVERACLRTKITGARFLSMPTEQTYTLEEEPRPEEKSGLLEKEKHIIEIALSNCNGKIEGKNSAAEQLGLKGTTLRAKMRRLGIEFPNSKR